MSFSNCENLDSAFKDMSFIYLIDEKYLHESLDLCQMLNLNENLF